MALTRCRECGNDVSEEAVSCPHCGAPYPSRAEWKGRGFEWKSAASVGEIPLCHIAFGRDSKGKRRVAKGIVAIGQYAVGVITVAQFGVGILTLAQFGAGALFTIGQFALGYAVIGQVAVGYYALAQIAVAEFGWSMYTRDPEALEFFRSLPGWLGVGGRG